MTDILAAIDDAVEGRCVTCHKTLLLESLSAWFCDQYCQKAWYQTRVTDPDEVENSPDYWYDGGDEECDNGYQVEYADIPPVLLSRYPGFFPNAVVRDITIEEALCRDGIHEAGGGCCDAA